jgi:glycosyltransferase involved in cell wall biosynthesis
MRVALLIRSLDIGGAERQLVELARGLHSRGVTVQVLTFYAGGPLRSELEAAGVPVRDLAKRGRWDTWGFLGRLVRTLRELQPDALYAFLPVANIFAVLARPLVSRRMRVVWGVRASNVDLHRYDWTFRIVSHAERAFARFADVIVANSRAGRDHLVALGFPAERIVVIPNGIDTGRFRFDPDGRRRVRAEWGVGDDELLIGLVARLDPMKGHETFLEAAALFARDEPKARFVCVGDGPPTYRSHLRRRAAELGLESRLVWSGARRDMPAVYSALDIATSSSSYGEGFSNAIAEAMACGRPVVATDVGDSAHMLAGHGSVVPAREPAALARAWLANSRPQHPTMSNSASQHVEALYSQEALIERSLQVLAPQ